MQVVIRDSKAVSCARRAFQFPTSWMRSMQTQRSPPQLYGATNSTKSRSSTPLPPQPLKDEGLLKVFWVLSPPYQGR